MNDLSRSNYLNSAIKGFLGNNFQLDFSWIRQTIWEYYFWTEQCNICNLFCVTNSDLYIGIKKCHMSLGKELHGLEYIIISKESNQHSSVSLVTDWFLSACSYEHVTNRENMGNQFKWKKQPKLIYLPSCQFRKIKFPVFSPS